MTTMTPRSTAAPLPLAGIVLALACLPPMQGCETPTKSAQSTDPAPSSPAAPATRRAPTTAAPRLPSTPPTRTAPPPAASKAPAPRWIAANQPRRYELVLRTLVDESQPGEIQATPLDTHMRPPAPQPLRVLRQGEGFRAPMVEVPLEGMDGTPPYLKCDYYLRDSSRKRTTLLIDRSVKFWHAQRPFIAGLPPDAPGGRGGYVKGALIDMLIADVAVDQCPATWGEALTLAMGAEVWPRVKTRPMPVMN